MDRKKLSIKDQYAKDGASQPEKKMKYFQMFENLSFHEISEEVFESGGSKRGKGLLFFAVENGIVKVITGEETPDSLLDFDGLSIEDDRIENDDIEEGYLESMQRMALQDTGDTMHKLFCEVAAISLEN